MGLVPTAQVIKEFGFDPAQISATVTDFWYVGECMEEEDEDAGASPGDLIVDSEDGENISDFAESQPNYVGTSTDVLDDSRRFYYFRPVAKC